MGKQKLWHTWEARFANFSLAALLTALIALVYAFVGGNEEDLSPAYDPPLGARLKLFFGVFLFFYIPMLIGLLRGQKIAAKLEALKNNYDDKQ